MFKYSITTGRSYTETLTALENSLVEHKFGVLWKLDVKENLKKKGVDFDKDFHIFEVCNAPKAKEVLERNILVGYFLPCKIVVYVDKGETVIGMVRPTTIVEFLGDQNLVGFASEVEEILIKAIDAVK
ncbi:MAG: DUF302 domain-containing protein [Firmicutes bacterium]|nr:DUF302 domain-containing protein [Bacillota bacterium]